MMTEAQKKMIAKMRDLGAGYTEVAKQLDLPVGTIKTYCRRNRLTGDPIDVNDVLCHAVGCTFTTTGSLPR